VSSFRRGRKDVRQKFRAFVGRTLTKTFSEEKEENREAAFKDFLLFLEFLHAKESLIGLRNA
jgi:hypothetical protein